MLIVKITKIREVHGCIHATENCGQYFICSASSHCSLAACKLHGEGTVNGANWYYLTTILSIASSIMGISLQHFQIVCKIFISTIIANLA